jgi:hypothetical protein
MKSDGKVENYNVGDEWSGVFILVLVFRVDGGLGCGCMAGE